MVITIAELAVFLACAGGRRMGTGNAVWSLGEGAERRLLRKMAAGDKAARGRFVEAHLGIVPAVARRYAKRFGIAIDDLMQEGTLALVCAIDHYDPTGG